MVPDQQPAERPHELPRDEQHQEVTAQHEQFHRGHEDEQQRHETPPAGRLGHVCVPDDRGRDRRDQEQHHRPEAGRAEGQREDGAPPDRQLAGRADDPPACRHDGEHQGDEQEPSRSTTGQEPPRGGGGQERDQWREQDHPLSFRSFSVMSARRAL